MFKHYFCHVVLAVSEIHECVEVAARQLLAHSHSFLSFLLTHPHETPRRSTTLFNTKRGGTRRNLRRDVRVHSVSAAPHEFVAAPATRPRCA